MKGSALFETIKETSTTGNHHFISTCDTLKWIILYLYQYHMYGIIQGLIMFIST